MPAGIGRATFKAIRRLWFGISPRNSGIYSAGNGPAMRAAPFGAFFGSNNSEAEKFLRTSTIMTHTDNRAFIASKAIMLVAAEITDKLGCDRPSFEAFVKLLNSANEDDAEWSDLVAKIEGSLARAASVEEFAANIGCEDGVSAYVYHTVPVAVYAWYHHHGDFEQTIASVLNCGGDTDTVAAITGALAGLSVGDQGIPPNWISGIWDYPRSVAFLRKLAAKLAEARNRQMDLPKVFYPAPFCLLRNFAFLMLDLLHVASNVVRGYLLKFISRSK